MPLVQIVEGRHLPADEYVNGVRVKIGVLTFPGETVNVSAAEHVELKKDTKRFTDKGKG